MIWDWWKFVRERPSFNGYGWGWDDGERGQIGMGMSADGEKFDGDGWGQIPIPMQLSSWHPVSTFLSPGQYFPVSLSCHLASIHQHALILFIQTLALYKSFTYLLTYLLTFFNYSLVWSRLSSSCMAFPYHLQYTCLTMLLCFQHSPLRCCRVWLCWRVGL